MASTTVTAGHREISGQSTTPWLPVALTLAILVLVASIFWIDSRYPALYKKFHQGANVRVRGAITFDNVLPVTPAMPLPKRVAFTTVNWLAANRVGMTFGFLFGAGLLSLLPRLKRAATNNPYKNVLWGTLAGVPLGVCANCVAPIGQGLYASGVRRESALATMISSPTLNVVVLAALFSLFPLPLAALKLGMTFLVLLVFLPRLAAKSVSADSSGTCAVPAAEALSWNHALFTTLKTYLKNLWYLLRTAGLLMLLAAALGALAIELIPQTALHAAVTPLRLTAVAIVGTFLPVPMAFDVFASFVALRSGVPLPYVATLLCTLGAYSVYSFLVTGKAISWRTASSVFAAISLTGILAGIATAAFLS
ncbi:MAG TPA: hypothetical protein VEG30_14055 [Terriglobales bacterium]|nr:hypothetical protein [Terriglobales bacterium]